MDAIRKQRVSIRINSVEHAGEVEPRLLLVHFIRAFVGLTGTHIGCETSICGACTVMLNDTAVKSCTVLAVQADGILTTHQLLIRNPQPTEDEIRHALDGNLCRCTGYQHIVDAVQYEAKGMKGKAATRRRGA